MGEEATEADYCSGPTGVGFWAGCGIWVMMKFEAARLTGRNQDGGVC